MFFIYPKSFHHPAMRARHVICFFADFCRVEKTDRRYRTVTLSAFGRRLVPVLVDMGDRNDQEFFSHLSGQERASLFAVLRNIA
jgi:hypothetical protein